ncbi:VOC family protein [Streptomyces sp. NPDC006530]|uniref:VOC family protein n=1 Tax=Streptomyces sp. NPDC006530 TaxID=3364750 RepID=UPI0036A2D941
MNIRTKARLPAGAEAHDTALPAAGMRLASAVLYVSDLGESIRFYRELLNLQACVGTREAALLVSDGGSELYLRALGERAPRAPGGIGVQCLIWTAPSISALHRCEQVLKERDAYIGTQIGDGFTWAEGRDPSDVPVVITHPEPNETTRTHITSRIYAW